MVLLVRTISLLIFILSTIVIKSSVCQRRIVDGKTVESDKGFMVYLLMAEKRIRAYKDWLCGGCIVHPWYVLTAAGCLHDVKFVYVISGYKKYVKAEDIDKDECTKRKKKKIIWECVHKEYDFKDFKSTWWNFIDIALARVESPFDFHDSTYKKYCSYIPTTIPVNYDYRYAQEGRDTITYGWGHNKYYRPIGDTNDYNEKFLKYSSSVIANRHECSKVYHGTGAFRNMHEYGVCTREPGNFDDRGKLIVPFTDLLQNCIPTRRSSSNTTSNSTNCNETLGYYTTSRRNMALQNNSFTRRNNITSALRSGICQNDHGGPLVTWIGGHEVVIGVASFFLVNKNMECVGPYVYTATHCVNRFLDCILKTAKTRRQNIDCDEVKKNMVENSISWKNHPDGPARNEDPNTYGPLDYAYY